MIVRLPGGKRQLYIDPQRTYARFERVDGTTMTLADLDRVIAVAARAADGWNQPLQMQRAPRIHVGPRGAPRKAFCIKKHPMSGDNLYVDPTGKRECRACRTERYRLTRRKPRQATARQFEVYEAVMRCGGITAAGRHLGISHGAVRTLVVAYCRNTGTDPVSLPEGQHGRPKAA